MATVTADYVARDETIVAPAPERTATLDWGNSAPLALLAFAVTTFMLSMINARPWRWA
jgi:succinate-acetate transporter protein